MVATGHNGSCRVSIPIRRVGLSRVNDFWRRAGSCRVIVMGNVARPGFAGSGVWPGRAGFPSMASPIGRVKPGQIWTSNMLGRLIWANTCPFSFSSQALLHDSRQFFCLDLYRFQIALTGARPGFPGFPGSGFSRVQADLNPTGLCRVLCVRFTGSPAPVRVCGVAGQVVLSLGEPILQIWPVCPGSAGFAGPGRVVVTLL